MYTYSIHDDDVIKWKLFTRDWPFVRGIQRGPMASPHKGPWSESFMFSLICAWTIGRANNRDVCDLRHNRAYYDVTVMISRHWNGAKTRACLFCIVNVMVVHVPAMLGARASVAMVLTSVSQNIPVSAPDRLVIHHIVLEKKVQPFHVSWSLNHEQTDKPTDGVMNRGIDKGSGDVNYS